jgi:hypothetical protein
MQGQCDFHNIERSTLLEDDTTSQKTKRLKERSRLRGYASA